MRCALYLRVSTDRQARGTAGRYASDSDNAKHSLPTQIEACKQYARDNNWTINDDHIFVEADTAYELWERPELTRVRKLMVKQEIDVVLVYALDRLSRDLNHQGLLFSEGERYGVSIDSVTENVDDTPMGKFVRSSYGMIAEIEGQKITERSIRGRKSRAERGGEMPVIGVRPFGYNFDGARKERLVINENEAYWLRAIFERVANGQSLYQIKKFLEENKVPTARGRENWRTSTVAQIVRNELYKGVVYAFKYGYYTEERSRLAKKKNQNTLKPKDQWIKVDYTPPLIISPELWEEAQRVLSIRSKRRPSRSDMSMRDTVLLSGSGQIVCGVCGRQLSIQTVRRKLSTGEPKSYTYYRHPGETPSCRASTHRASDIDEQVLKTVLDYVLSPEKYHEQMRLREQEDPTQQDREMVQARLAEVRKEHQTQTRSFALVAADLDDMSRTVMLQDIRGKAEQITKLEVELERLKDRYQDWQARQGNIEDMEEILKGLAPTVANHEELDAEMRQVFMLALGVKVEVFPKENDPYIKVYVNPSLEEIQQQQIAEFDAQGVCTSSLTSSNEKQFTNWNVPYRIDNPQEGFQIYSKPRALAA